MITKIFYFCLTISLISQVANAQLYDEDINYDDNYQIQAYSFTKDVFIVGVTVPSLKTIHQIIKYYNLSLKEITFMKDDMYLFNWYNYNWLTEELPNGKVILLPPYTLTSEAKLLELKQNYRLFTQEFSPFELKLNDTLYSLKYNQQGLIANHPLLSSTAKQVLKHRKFDYPMSWYVRIIDSVFQVPLPHLAEDIRALGKLKINEYVTAYFVNYDYHDSLNIKSSVTYMYVFDPNGLMIQDPILVGLAKIEKSEGLAWIENKIFHFDDYGHKEIIVLLRYYAQNLHRKTSLYIRSYFACKTGVEKLKPSNRYMKDIEFFNRGSIYRIYDSPYNGLWKVD